MGGGACNRCGKDACTTSIRMVAVKNRLPCVDCKLELSTPPVCDPAAVPEGEPDQSSKWAIACICQEEGECAKASLLQINEEFLVGIGKVRARLVIDGYLGHDVAG